MMNKDDERYASAVEGGHRVGRTVDIMDTTTSGSQPSANKAIDMKSAASSRPMVVVGYDSSHILQLEPVKRKRKSPDKPWKKPPDMPKRPLSAYNIFFRDERERLLGGGGDGTGSERKQQSGEPATTVGEMRSSAAATASTSSKKNKNKSGIGFANLAKTIANRWNELGDEIRAPYEAIAAAEKKKYDELVADWRVKQAAKKKALAAAKKEAGEDPKASASTLRSPHNPYPSDRSLGSFSDTSNPYPTEWFHSGPEQHDPSSTMDQDDSTRTPVPPIVDTGSGMPSYDSSRTHGAGSHGWQQHSSRQQHHHQQDLSGYYHPQYSHHSVYEASGPVMRQSPDTERGSGSYMFPPDESGRGSMTQDFSPAYRDYYYHHHSSSQAQQSMYAQQHSSRRHTDMRMPRAASLPTSRHGELVMTQHHPPHQRPVAGETSDELDQTYQDIDRNVAHYRTSRVRQVRPSYPMTQQQVRGSTAAGYPRSSSMPYVQNFPPGSSSGVGSGRRRVRPIDYVDPSSSTMPPRSYHHSHHSYYDDSDVMHNDDSYRTLPASYGRSQPMITEAGGSGSSTMMMPPRRHHPQTSPMNVGTRSTTTTVREAADDTAIAPPAQQGLPSDSASKTTSPQSSTAAVAGTGASDGVVDEVVQTSLQNLTESLDDDAISFITSMKY